MFCLLFHTCERSEQKIFEKYVTKREFSSQAFFFPSNSGAPWTRGPLALDYLCLMVVTPLNISAGSIIRMFVNNPNGYSCV